MATFDNTLSADGALIEKLAPRKVTVRSHRPPGLGAWAQGGAAAGGGKGPSRCSATLPAVRD